VAEASANVVEVVHTRHGKFQINEAELELHIETRGSDHRTAVMKKLTDAGYKIRVVDDV
jgi:threonine dehydratase